MFYLFSILFKLVCLVLDTFNKNYIRNSRKSISFKYLATPKAMQFTFTLTYELLKRVKLYWDKPFQCLFEANALSLNRQAKSAIHK